MLKQNHYPSFAATRVIKHLKGGPLLALYPLGLPLVFFSYQVVMGGGQEAMEVTTTSTRIGKFEAR